MNILIVESPKLKKRFLFIPFPATGTQGLATAARFGSLIGKGGGGVQNFGDEFFLDKTEWMSGRMDEDGGDCVSSRSYTAYGLKKLTPDVISARLR